MIVAYAQLSFVSVHGAHFLTFVHKRCHFCIGIREPMMIILLLLHCEMNCGRSQNKLNSVIC